MSDKIMWAMMMKFGSNMWGKKGAIQRFDSEANYHETMFMDRKTWREVTDFMPKAGINTLLMDMGEGMKFDSHPELAVPGSWEKSEVKEEVARLREMGINPIPKMNFSGEHNAWLQDWGRMVGTESYYQMTQEIIEEMIEVFGTPEFLHLGLDEEGEGSIPTTPFTTIRNAPQFVEDAEKLFKVCLDKGVRPWIWIHPHSLEHAFGGKEYFCEHVPKDVLVSNWYYYNYATSKSGWPQLNGKLAEWGYENVPCCSTWNQVMNTKHTLKWCKDHVEQKDKLRGYLTAPWLHTIPSNKYGLMNAAWILKAAKEKYYPEECE